MIACRRRDRMRPGRWTSSTTSWRRDASCGFSRSSTSSPASRRHWHRGSHSVAPTSWRYRRGSAMKWDSRRRSASIKAPSSCHEISTSGPISAASHWTSPGQASRRTTSSSSVQRTLPGGMPQCQLVLESLAGAQEKVENPRKFSARAVRPRGSPPRSLTETLTVNLSP
jgi:hypothetical protein